MHTVNHEKVLAGRYRLTRRIAAGGMGQVWEARDMVLRRPVAVKVLRDDLADEPSFLRRFETEAHLAARISDPGIAAVHDYGVGDVPQRHAFLVMELVQGEPLSALLTREPVPPLDTTLDVLVQSAEALHAAHVQGVVHCDVKPSNILLARGGRVKLTDFGIARSLTEANATDPADLLGTPSYMSPEQARGEPATPASDVYALGVIAYQMLVGTRPFTGATPAAVAHAHVHRLPPPLPSRVPPSVRAVVESALAKDPSQRPESALAMARALRRPVRVAADEPTQPLRPVAAQRRSGHSGRSSVLAVAAAALLAATTAAAIGWSDDDAPAPTDTTTRVAAEGPTSLVDVTAAATVATTGAVPPSDDAPTDGGTPRNGQDDAKEKGKGNGKGKGKGNG